MTQNDLGLSSHEPLSLLSSLTEQSLMSGNTPLVSICCTTFNHSKYIQRTLDSFLLQETSFPVEIIVHDDASTDGTPDIVRTYAIRFPNLFRIILQHENQWKHGRRAMQIAMAAARGSFIALCEGDDFWTSPDKLERQVAMLKATPDALLCFHGHKEVDEDGTELPSRDARTPSEGLLPPGAYFKGKCEAWQTASFVIKREFGTSLPDWHKELPFTDVTLMALASLRGPLCSLPGVHSCYRIHQGGMAGKKRLEDEWEAKARGKMFWDQALAKLFEYLLTETRDPELLNDCRRHAVNYLNDVIWHSRLLGDHRQMRRAILKSLQIDPKSAVSSVKMWKDFFVAFSPLPDRKRSQHLRDYLSTSGSSQS